jgi:putative endonuclease
MPADWYVYILECEDGTLYTGVTKDTARRLKEHQQGGCRYTRAGAVAGCSAPCAARRFARISMSGF